MALFPYNRRLLYVTFFLLTALPFFFLYRDHLLSLSSYVKYTPPAPQESKIDLNKPKPKPSHAPWVYKEKPKSSPPIVDNFLLAAQGPDALPPIPEYNRPSSKHVDAETPLLIGFTRNWRLLQQTVVSYITAGWPPQDIYVVENTGTMRANEWGNLTLQNPFYLDYQRLTKTFGVNVVRTPTLLNFAQLQNFYLSFALDKEWRSYFWSHMDVVAVSDEGMGDEYRSLYQRAVEVLKESFEPEFMKKHNWGGRWFFYDNLELVNVKAFVDVGGWDTFISYYMTDCDMHERIMMAGYEYKDANIGHFWDVASTLDDLLVLYRRNATSASQELSSPPFQNELVHKAKSARQELDSTSSLHDLDTQGRTGADEDNEEKAEAGNDNSFPGVHPSSSSSPHHTSSKIKAYTSAATRGDASFTHLKDTLNAMQHEKKTNKVGRNTWQHRQEGGDGEPFYRDPEGFSTSIKMAIDHGKEIYFEKWGHKGCGLRKVGLKEEDAWRVEADWKPKKEKGGE